MGPRYISTLSGQPGVALSRPLLGDWKSGASLGSFVVFVASRACCRASSIDDDRRIFWASLATASSSSGLLGVSGGARCGGGCFELELFELCACFRRGSLRRSPSLRYFFDVLRLQSRLACLAREFVDVVVARWRLEFRSLLAWRRAPTRKASCDFELTGC